MKKISILLLSAVLFLCGCAKNDKNNEYETYFKGEYLCVKYKKSGYVKKVPVKNQEQYKLSFCDINKDTEKEVVLSKNDEILIYDFSGVPYELRRGFCHSFSVYPLENNLICVISDKGKSFTSQVNSTENLTISKPYNYSASYDEVLYKTDIKSDNKTVLTMNCTEKYEHGQWYLEAIEYERINE